MHDAAAIRLSSVTDTLIGNRRAHASSLGTPFQSIQDTDALACGS